VSRSQLTLLKKYGIRPVKRRGQHFLTDGNLARAIAADCLAFGDVVLELGAGGGPEGGRVVAAGIPEEVARGDRPTAPYLRQALGVGL